MARDVGAPSLFRLSEGGDVPFAGRLGALPASVMIVARSPATLSHLPLRSGDWRVFEAPPGRGWSDDYINLARALWEGMPGGTESCLLYSYQPSCAATAKPATTVSPSPAPPRLLPDQ